MARTDITSGFQEFFIRNGGSSSNSGLDVDHPIDTFPNAWAKVQRDYDARGSTIRFNLGAETLTTGMLASGGLVGQDDPFRVQVYGAGRRATLVKPTSGYPLQAHYARFSFKGVGFDGRDTTADSLAQIGVGSHVLCEGDVLIGRSRPTQFDIQPGFRAIFQVNTTANDSDMIEVEKEMIRGYGNFYANSKTIGHSGVSGIAVGDAVSHVANGDGYGGQVFYQSIASGTFVTEIVDASHFKINNFPLQDNDNGSAQHLLFTKPALAFLQLDEQSYAQIANVKIKGLGVTSYSWGFVAAWARQSVAQFDHVTFPTDAASGPSLMQVNGPKGGGANGGAVVLSFTETVPGLGSLT